jgi:hypothetical protein
VSEPPDPNELLATGALLAGLMMAKSTRIVAEPERIDGVFTTSLLVRFPGILKSQYKVTVELLPGTEDDIVMNETKPA